ncbi:MAG TPA: PAS domain-containing sensor histidine kinase [Bryobacteraceae bacterium]|nr:PAS domain-containing sensor histidine kinase [Bryobacteraceae bacterium]
MSTPENATASNLARNSPGQRRAGSGDQREQREHFELLIECVFDYALITYDLDNHITGWNIGAERTLGYPESESLGQPGDILFTPEDRERGEVQRELECAILEGRATDERWHLKRDGSRFWASGVMTLLRDDQGQPRGFAKVLRDLTERKNAEDAIRASEERLRLFIETVSDHALFDVDPDARITSWNSGAESLFGYRQQEILGQHVATLFPAEYREQGYVEQELARTVALGKVEAEQWLVRRDGSRFFARWATHRILDDRGELRGFAKVLRDDTERLLVEQRRRELEQQERARLQGQVAHTGAELDRRKDELRALAASLLTAQEEERRRIARELHDDLSQRLALVETKIVHLRNSAGLTQQVMAEVERIREDLAALSELVRNLSHRLHPSMLEDLGLEPALRVLVEELEAANDLGVRLAISPLPGRLPVETATALYRITQEALRNVVKHAPGALVTVRLSHIADSLVLTIQDDGPGFDRDAVRGARGLGLISMQERAGVLGGTVTINTVRGTGTEIVVKMPWRAGQ